jgi:hypothetical protein
MTSSDEINNNDGTVELTAECLCKANKFTAQIQRAELPLRTAYCHCDSCRHVTGAMHTSEIPWHGDGAAIHSAVTLRRYAFSQRLGLLFCPTCGTPMFFETRGEGSAAPKYGVLTGVLANIDVKSLFKITDHLFVGDTLDGGATPWLCDTNGDDVERPRLWHGHRDRSELLEQPPVANSDATALAPSTGDKDNVNKDDKDEIPIRCKCGGVDLVLRRPIADYATKARSELPWVVDPVSNKSLGGFDACDSCRLSSGTDVFNWTFCLMQHLSFPTSGNTTFPQSTIELRKAVAARGSNRDSRWGTLTFYESSPDVQRYFCGRCSATVFYAADDRPEMADLAIGLLWSKHGARVEELVSWDFGGKMGWRQDVVGGWREHLVERIEEAAERWRVQRGLSKNWRRILKEEAA